jgi:serine/threonine-protein kinase HipA
MTVLSVFLENYKVGHLTLLPNEGTIFTFAESYVKDPQRPVLSQSYFDKNREILTKVQMTQVKLPPFFSNLLPEGHLRQYLADLGGINSEREFALLQLLANDLPGAIRVSPFEQESGMLPTNIKPDSTSDEKDSALHFSLAGVQLKFSAIESARGGLTIPAQGIGGNWIVKLPFDRFNHVPENEWSMLQLAKSIGISVPNAELIPVKKIVNLPQVEHYHNKNALAVKRFDRVENNRRIHIEDFAQVYGLFPHEKYRKVSYANIASMVWQLTGEKGLIDFIQRLTFTLLIGNGDMHLKNWSFIYYDTYTPELAPAYDFVSTIPYLPQDQLALTFVNTKDIKAINRPLLLRFADKSKIPNHLVLSTVSETVERTHAAWKKHANHYPLNKQLIHTISQHLETMALQLS